MRTITGLVQTHPDYEPQNHLTVNAMRHPKEAGSDLQRLFTMIAQLWRHGIALDWSGFYSGQTRRRLSLPTYPFERQRFWLDGNLANLGNLGNLSKINSQPGGDSKRALDDWFYVPGWKRSELNNGSGGTSRGCIGIYE